VCEEDGKIANDACKNADKTKIKNFVKIIAELPEWQPFVDRWVEKNYKDKEEYFPPSTKSELEFDDDGDVEKDVDPKITFPGLNDGDTLPLEFRLSVEVSSPNDIEYVRFSVDGDSVGEDKSVPYGYTFTFSPEQAGEHEFSVRAEDDDGREGKKTIKLKITD
jgi:hypothetical protein